MPQPPAAPFQMIRKMLPYTAAAACLAMIYVGWVFYSRSNENSEWQKQADQKYIEQAQKNYEMYGSGQLKILLFYAVPAVVTRGGAAQLCYSVGNASTVKIDHGVEEIKPSLNRCVPVQPIHSTTYTLSAADDAGHQATQSVTLEVR